MKKILICLTVFFSIFLFNNQVNAEEFTVSSTDSRFGVDVIFHDTGIENYISNINSENINKIIDTYKEDGYTYDGYMIIYIAELNTYDILLFDKRILDKTTTTSYVYMYAVPSQNIYRLRMSAYSHEYQTLRIGINDNDLTNYSLSSRITNNSSNTKDLLSSIKHDSYNIYYYTNVDNFNIKNSYSQVVGTLNNNGGYLDSPAQPEDTRNIITILADTLNGFITNLNENGITFSEILVGLFIFNFVVYVITYMVRHFE